MDGPQAHGQGKAGLRDWLTQTGAAREEERSVPRASAAATLAGGAGDRLGGRRRRSLCAIHGESMKRCRPGTVRKSMECDVEERRGASVTRCFLGAVSGKGAAAGPCADTSPVPQPPLQGDLHRLRLFGRGASYFLPLRLSQVDSPFEEQFKRNHFQELFRQIEGPPPTCRPALTMFPLGQVFHHVLVPSVPAPGTPQQPPGESAP